MIVEMDNMPVPSWETARRIYEKNIELDNRRGKSAQARIPSDPNIWQQMRENYEKIILEDHSFSEKHNIEHALWQLHYKRIEELRAHYTAAQASANSNASSNGKGPSSRPDRITKIRLQFKTFLSEASGFYHELILKIRSKYGLPLCYFSEDADNGLLYEKDGKNSADVRKVLISCHRCLIYLGDLARYKGLYGEPDSKAREFAAASSYYLQAASLWPSIGNPHHQLAILASYSGDDLVTIYRYFRSLAVANPCSTARDNLIVIFEKNRQSYSQLHIDARTSTVWSAGKGRGQQAKVGSNDTVAKAATFKKSEPNSHDTYKSLCICYVRLNGILFTRSSLETFAEVVSLVVTGLSDLLSSGPEEKMNFGKDAFENGLFFVRLVSTLIFTIHNVKRESEGQTYAEIVQSTVLLQNAFTAVFEIMGHVMKRCEQVHGPSLSYLLPGILVFVEWLASYPDFARGCGNDEKQATARSNFWSHYVSLMNKLLSMGLMSIDDCKDESCFGNTSKFEEGETGNQLALWEDFELRGFLPLVPAQTILDFTMKHSFGSEGHREKCFRVKRTLAAWKVLVGVVKINDKMVCYDSEAKKFVIGVESQLSGEDLSPPNSTVLKANNLVLENLGKTAVKFEESLPKSQLYVEGEDKDEKIVFQLTAVEKRPDTALQNLVPFGTLEPQKNDFIGNSYRKSPYVAMNYLVGIDKQVEDMMDLLDLEVSDVRIVGIWGKGGVGKTTLAKVIYEQISSRFDCSSFLADITATVKHLGGVRLLQSKLMSDILKLEYKVDHVAKGVEFFKEILRKMKVLIVLDDVEVWSHLHEIVGEELDWFGNGSRIIVTTTIINVLPEFISHGLAHVYSINMMDNDQALELFRKHALHRNPPILDIDEIAKGIINSVNRNPLLIEVIGSLLYRKVVEEWTALEEFLQSGLDIEDILEVSYEELSKEQREIFLDIACLPADVDYRMASYMWHNPHFLPSDGVDALHVMSLVKVGKNNELGMHRLLREFGKQIIKKEDYLDPGKRGRLCNLELPSISETEGTDHLNFVAEDFKSMPNIRFLILDCANVFGDFANVFPNLKWLQWQGCTRDFEATNFHVEKLVVLDLSWSKVTEDWGGWREIKMPQLKVLNLTGCGDLLISPNLSSFPDLEILILERCSRLMKLDSSIRHLKYLTSLNLRFCNQLNMLPIELGHLKALKELLIDGTSVQEIPMSMGYMERLEIFSASNCLQLSHLPDSVFRLIALSVLSLENAKITQISNSVEKLVKLRHLSLRDCRWIGRLPDSICHLEGLEQLDISGTGISILPDSITCLRRLKVLKMDYCFIRELPREIGSLANLEELHASHCRSLKGAIPTAIKSLDHLRILRLGHSSISSIPLEIISLSCLQTFDLLQCNKIQALPELPSSLTCVRVSSERMRALPDLKNLVKLEEICLGDKDPKELICPSIWMKPRASLRDPFVVPIGLPKLKILELSHSRIIDLRFRCGSLSCTHLEKLVLSGVNLQEVSELPASLSVLSIQHCSSLKRLSAVQHLRRLSELNLIQSAVEEIKGLEGLIALEILNILYCEIQNLNGLGQLRALRRLILSDCNSLDRLPDISHLKMLNVLEVQRCGMIHDIEGLMELTSLEVLHVSECKAENTQQVQGALNLMMARSVNT